MSLSLCQVVLVETHYPGNIGATARVMTNFGLSALSLVRPRVDPLDPAAKQMSTRGEPILHAAQRYETLADAIANCSLIVGASARHGGLFRKQTVRSPDEAMALVSRHVRTGQPAAIVFGPEPTGLTDDELSLCNYLTAIPTDEAYPSLNLAQAVAICLYELRKAWNALTVEPATIEPGDTAATFAEQQRAFEHLEVAFREIHFLFGGRAEALMHAFRHMLGKAKLSSMEVKLLFGLARQIRWYVQQAKAGNANATDIAGDDESDA